MPQHENIYQLVKNTKTVDDQIKALDGEKAEKIELDIERMRTHVLKRESKLRRQSQIEEEKKLIQVEIAMKHMKEE